MIAVNMFEQDKPSKEIAAWVGRDAQTVRAWKRQWEKLGRDGLRSKPHPGRPCLMSDQQKQELLAMLDESPTAHGFGRHFWTTEMIADLIKRKFGIDYNHDWVGEMLHALGCSWQKPERRARERDEVRIASWRRDTWDEIKKKRSKPTA